MNTLVVSFFVIMIGLGFLVVLGKINWIQYSIIALVIGFVVMFVPVFVQHQSLTNDKEFVSKGENFSKIYYSVTEDKYYDIALQHNWRFWDVYSVTEISENNVPKE